MNIEFEMLKAQHEALRTYFISLLPVIFSQDEQQKIDGSKPWLAKYLLWCFERENLSTLENDTRLSSPEKDVIGRRRFQLQVLMDVAYIRGGLEEYDIQRRISAPDRDLAEAVYRGSDGSEEQMVRMIDKYCK